MVQEFAFIIAVLSSCCSHRIYDQLLDPREHPDYLRRHIQPPGWYTFNNRTQFTCLRGFSIQDDQIVNYKEEIDKYTKIHNLGNVIWPSYPILFAKNLGDLADEIRERNLYLFDIWGYVPGSGPGGYWQQFKPPDGVFEMLESKLGERWLGMDVGEQDGRYVGGYANQMYPSSANRFEQYLNFQRHFQRMCDQLGNKMSTLVSLNFGHYFLKEGIYTLIGAETAQALPNSQVYYAFIRGAGKQYGVPWFGNASIFNRWGYKVYGAEGFGEGAYGPTKGTSLSLMKRLLYSHILYNSMIVGFESSWFEGEKLSPIGKIQQSANQWVEENGQPGTMITPIALMLDFFSGWSFPRQLYSGDVYRVWGNLPYGSGDYLTDGVIDILYPGYQNSSYYHDESGFMSPTPFGDSADCILSDAGEWLLDRYAVLVIADELSGDLEIRDKLHRYVEKGGHLVITAGNLKKFSEGIAETTVCGNSIKIDPQCPINIGSNIIKEEKPFELYRLCSSKSIQTYGICNDIPIAIEVSYVKGRMTVFASPFGINSEPSIDEPVKNEIDKPLPKPYPLQNHVKTILEQIFSKKMLFSVGEGLSFITCRKGEGEYTLGIFNNSLEWQTFEIISHCGKIESITELQTDQSEKTSIGYLPEGFENSEIGISSGKIIAGGDVRIFSVKVKEENVEIIPHVIPKPGPKNCILPLRRISSIKEEILSRPTFFEHFDGVIVDWRYLLRSDKNALKLEYEWLKRQGVKIIVDLSSGINLYPDLRLVNNLEEDYQESMMIIEEIINKMKIIGSMNLVLSLHRYPENNFTAEQTENSFIETLQRICDSANKHNININLRICNGKPPWNITDAIKYIERVKKDNFFLAPTTALIIYSGLKIENLKDLMDKIRILMVSSPEYDISGHLWNANASIAGRSDVIEIISSIPQAIIVLDSIYYNKDMEYKDAYALDVLE